MPNERSAALGNRDKLGGGRNRMYLFAGFVAGSVFDPEAGNWFQRAHARVLLNDASKMMEEAVSYWDWASYGSIQLDWDKVIYRLPTEISAPSLLTVTYDAEGRGFYRPHVGPLPKNANSDTRSRQDNVDLLYRQLRAALNPTDNSRKDITSETGCGLPKTVVLTNGVRWLAPREVRFTEPGGFGLLEYGLAVIAGEHDCTTATHELGHLFGLNNSEIGGNIMSETARKWPILPADREQVVKVFCDTPYPSEQELASKWDKMYGVYTPTSCDTTRPDTTRPDTTRPPR